LPINKLRQNQVFYGAWCGAARITAHTETISSSSECAWRHRTKIRYVCQNPLRGFWFRWKRHLVLLLPSECSLRWCPIFARFRVVNTLAVAIWEFGPVERLPSDAPRVAQIVSHVDGHIPSQRLRAHGSHCAPARP